MNEAHGTTNGLEDGRVALGRWLIREAGRNCIPVLRQTIESQMNDPDFENVLKVIGGLLMERGAARDCVRQLLRDEHTAQELRVWNDIVHFTEPDSDAHKALTRVFDEITKIRLCALSNGKGDPTPNAGSDENGSVESKHGQ